MMRLMAFTRWFSVCCIFLLRFQNVYGADGAYEVIADKAQILVLSPDLQGQKKLKIRLSNGLEAYLISDPNADKSGAALSVAVGSWDDPAEYPGLAHFLEHMLFLGTEKYPEESSYQKFIAENGGETNAFTSSLQTAFLFSVNHESFEEGLDRFSQFFKKPLFNPSGVSRELHAINQEYATHLDNDQMRLFMVDKGLSNPNHPYHNFSLGNSETLSQVSQKILQDWYLSHYSANLMRLIVYSSLPIEQLREMVVADFKDVINTKRSMSEPKELMWGPQENPELIYVDAVKNSRTLQIVWDLPEKFAKAGEYKPSILLCFVLGHEGDQSLLAELKRKKLAEKLQCSAFKLTPKMESIYLDIELTDEGLEHVQEVIGLIFQTIARLQQEEVPSYLFREVEHMGQLNYSYQSRQEAFTFMMQHALQGFNEELATYPEESVIVKKFDPLLVKELAKALTPAEARFYLLAPASVTGVKPDKEMKWMGIKYGVVPISKALLEEWTSGELNQAITLPPPNKFIPEKRLVIAKPELKGVLSEKVVIPKAITVLDDKRGKVFYAKDKFYLVPKSFITLTLITPQVEMGSPAKTVLADLYAKALTERLKNISYPAELAGISYAVKRENYGIILQIEGYQEKLELFFDEVIQRLKHLEISEQQFDLYRQALRREYQNFSKEAPLEQAIEQLKVLLYRKFSTEKQKLAAINRVSYDKVKEYFDKVFNEVYLKGLFYGALEEEEAKRMVDKLLKELQAKAYAKGPHRREEVIKLKENQGPFFFEVSSKAQGNAVCLAIEYPRFSFQQQAAQQILMRGIELPFFATLRTKQQTGYIVYSGPQEVEEQLFDFFGVQSSSHASRDLLARFELFIEGFLQEIKEEIPEPCFLKMKRSVLDELEKPVRNMKEMSDLLYRLAFKRDGDFDWVAKRIAAAEALTYEEFVKLAQENLGKDNPRRLAILLTGVESDEKVFQYRSIGNVLRLRKASVYTTSDPKSGLGVKRF